MAIEWKQEPAWGYGNGALPVNLDTLYRRLLINYINENAPVLEPRANCPGWYNARIGGVSLNRFLTTGNIAGAIPGSAIVGSVNAKWTKTLMAMSFPNANAVWMLYMKNEYLPQYALNSLSIYTKWQDPDGNDITSQIHDFGFSVNPAWETGHNGIAGPPCEYAVIYPSPDHEETLYGITVSGTTYYTPPGGGLAGIAWDGGTLLINIKEYAAYLQEQNPELDFGVWEVEDPYSDEAGPASSSGGYGGYGGDITASDSYEMDPVPTASAASLGFINMYNPSAGGLSNLGEEIFPDFEFNSVVDPTGNDLLDAILNGVAAFVDGINQIPKMFEVYINSRLIDYVQDCHIVPVAPTVGAAAHIKLGFRELETTAPKITTEYVVADLGSVNLTEFYQSFIDYLPFTRAKLYLPFVGFVPLEPEYWQNGTISVKYKFNVYDGSFTANVIATPDPTKISKMVNTVVGQYTGTAIVHVPLTGLNYSSMVSGLIGGAGSMVSAIAGGNVAAAATAALNTAASSPQVMTSNAYTASAAFLGQRKPFIVIERSVSHFPLKYTHDVGLPSKITTDLGSASGFTTVGEVDLSGIGASAEEKAAIRSLLASGVYF